MQQHTMILTSSGSRTRNRFMSSFGLFLLLLIGHVCPIVSFAEARQTKQKNDTVATIENAPNATGEDTPVVKSIPEPDPPITTKDEVVPSARPSAAPTKPPTEATKEALPTMAPSSAPSAAPTNPPTEAKKEALPTMAPSGAPSAAPTKPPTKEDKDARPDEGSDEGNNNQGENGASDDSAACNVVKSCQECKDLAKIVADEVDSTKTCAWTNEQCTLFEKNYDIGEIRCEGDSPPSPSVVSDDNDILMNRPGQMIFGAMVILVFLCIVVRKLMQRNSTGNVMRHHINNNNASYGKYQGVYVIVFFVSLYNLSVCAIIWIDLFITASYRLNVYFLLKITCCHPFPIPLF
jgi:hypothetical protein